MTGSHNADKVHYNAVGRNMDVYQCPLGSLAVLMAYL